MSQFSLTQTLLKPNSDHGECPFHSQSPFHSQFPRHSLYSLLSSQIRAPPFQMFCGCDVVAMAQLDDTVLMVGRMIGGMTYPVASTTERASIWQPFFNWTPTDRTPRAAQVCGAACQ